MKKQHPAPNEKNGFILKISRADFDKVLRREVDHIDVCIDDDAATAVLENINDNLILCCDEMPTTYYSCYMWNKGDFPYLIRKDLKYIKLTDGRRRFLTVRLTDHDIQAGERFHFSPEGRGVPDAEGDACIWTVRFRYEPCAEDGTPLAEGDDGLVNDRNFYLLRWNPAISSLTLDLYKKHIEQHWRDGVFDWSVYEWEDAHEGDAYFMLRTGDERAGIVYCGTFESDPYVDDDWAGSAHPRHYCRYSVATRPAPADGAPLAPLALLEQQLPEINWRRGHSGEKITPEQATRLFNLMLRCEKGA